MISLFRAEQAFSLLIKNLPFFLRESLIRVDPHQLAILGLDDQTLLQPPDQKLSYCRFCVAEASGKLTLINEMFVAWIVPKWNSAKEETLLIVATCQAGDIHPITALILSGPRNTPNAALKILEGVLIDIRENDLLCTTLGKSCL